MSHVCRAFGIKIRRFLHCAEKNKKMRKNCCVVRSHPNLFNNHTIVSNDGLYRSLLCEIRTVAVFPPLAQIAFLCSHSCQLHQMFTSTREQGRDVNKRLNPIHGGLLTGGVTENFVCFIAMVIPEYVKRGNLSSHRVTPVLILNAVICKRITNFNTRNIFCANRALILLCVVLRANRDE